MMALVSWLFWIGWMLVGLGYEVFAVIFEKRTGALPLTRVLRDRLARRFVIARLALLLFLAWLGLHFLGPLSW